MSSGHVIAGKYRLERVIGRGGMGLVWQARHTELGTPLAVKVLAAGAESDPRALRRFRQEARAAAALRCPHVVDVRDYGLDGGAPYIVMELLEGESLAARLTRNPALTLSELAELAAQAAAALDYAHARGFLHRDVKPSNLFLARAGATSLLKVLDFGIVKSLHEAGGAESTLVGSPGYLSPEQARGQALDHTTDLWSLGAVLYRAVTGVEPFAAASLADVVERVCVRPILPPSTIQPDLPPLLDAFFARALSREREGRFRSAAELANEFAAVTLDLPAHPLPIAERDASALARSDSTQSWASFSNGTRHLPSERKRRPLAIVVASALIAATVLALVLVAAFTPRARSATRAPTSSEPPASAEPRAGPAGAPPSDLAGTEQAERATPPPRPSAAPVAFPQRRPREQQETTRARIAPPPSASARAASGVKLDPTFGLPVVDSKERAASAHGASVGSFDDH